MMRVVTTNLAFTAAYNVVGRSLPDVGILENLARMLRQRPRTPR